MSSHTFKAESKTYLSDAIPANLLLANIALDAEGQGEQIEMYFPTSKAELRRERDLRVSSVQSTLDSLPFPEPLRRIISRRREAFPILLV